VDYSIGVETDTLELSSTEITTTTNAIKYLKDLSVKIIQNITPG
jgi:hypothetical protein